VLCGGLLGALVSSYVAFWSPLSFLWPSMFGLLATLICGWGVSVLQGAPATPSDQTFSRVMARPETPTESEAR